MHLHSARFEGTINSTLAHTQRTPFLSMCRRTCHSCLNLTSAQRHVPNSGSMSNFTFSISGYESQWLVTVPFRVPDMLEISFFVGKSSIFTPHGLWRVNPNYISLMISEKSHKIYWNILAKLLNGRRQTALTNERRGNFEQSQ